MTSKALVIGVVGLGLALSVTTAHPQSRTYVRDKYGAKEHSKGHYETDSSGRTVHVDKYGLRDYSRGSYQTDKDGVTVKVEKSGQKQWSEGSFVTEKPKARN